MSTPAQPVKKAATTPTASTVTPKTQPKPVGNKGNQVFLFDKDNYRWMIGGVLLIIIGFFLLSGGKSPDPHKFNYDEIYSFRRITLAPIVIMIGFVVEVFAIMKKPKQTQE